MILSVENNNASTFISQGFIKQSVEDPSALNNISQCVFELACEHLNVNTQVSPIDFFNNVAEHVSPERLNGLRMHIIQGLLQSREFHNDLFKCGQSLIEEIIGNELAIQRNMGFNIQLPGDDSSLLAPHSDVWGSECSPFECVFWLPLVDCFRTKSIFFLPPEKDRLWRSKIQDFSSMDEVFDAIKNDVLWVDVNYGEFLLFTSTCLHGNRINEESETRWSFNVRFKGLFTPYSGKGFGEYFQPLTIKPITRIGMSFQFPRVDNE